MPEPSDREGAGRRARFEEEVGSRARRKAEARRHRERGLWSWLGVMGIVGWSVALPAVAGVFLGAWIDRRWPGRVSWTLTLMLGGLALGCLQAWFWVKRESGGDDK